MYNSKAFLLILVENMIIFQGTFSYCVPHCNKTVHDLFRARKHTLVKSPPCQCREQASTLEGSWRSCNSSNSSACAISALAFHMVSKKETILPLFLPPKSGTEE